MAARGDVLPPTSRIPLPKEAKAVLAARAWTTTPTRTASVRPAACHAARNTDVDGWCCRDARTEPCTFAIKLGRLCLCLWLWLQLHGTWRHNGLQCRTGTLLPGVVPAERRTAHQLLPILHHKSLHLPSIPWQLDDG